MPGDPVLEKTPANGAKRRRPSAGDDDVPAAKRSYTDAEVAAEVAQSLHLREQRREEVRAIYLSYGTLLKGGESGSEALAFQGLLDCANGSLGARRLAARLVPRFLPRFPSHSEQALRLLIALYNDDQPEGRSHGLCRHPDRGLPNGKAASAGPALSAAVTTGTGGSPRVRAASPMAADGPSDDASSRSQLAEAMRRDALLGLGNVLEAAVRQPERNLHVVQELVLFLVGQLHRLSGDLPAAAAPAGSPGGEGAHNDDLLPPGLPSRRGCGSRRGQRGEGCRHGAGVEAEANGDSFYGRSGHSRSRSDGGFRGSGEGPAHQRKASPVPGGCVPWEGADGHDAIGGSAGDSVDTAADAVDPDSEAGIVRSLVLRAFCLFPRVVLATCLQPSRVAGSASRQQLQQKQQPYPGCGQAACELVLGRLLRTPAAPGTPAAHASAAAAGAAVLEGEQERQCAMRVAPASPPAAGGMTAVTGAGGITVDGGPSACSTVLGDRKDLAALQADTAAGSASAASPSSGLGSSCLAGHVLSHLPETQAWLRQMAIPLTKGKLVHELSPKLRAQLDRLLQFCTAAPPPIATAATAAVAGMSGGKASPKASPGSSTMGPAGGPAPLSAGAKQPAWLRADGGGAAGAQPAATHSMLGSDDGSRSVPMDLDQSISTVVRHDGGAGPAGVGGVAAAAVGPPDTAATPAPPPLPQLLRFDSGALPPLPPPPPPPSELLMSPMSYREGPSLGLRGGGVCRAEACLYIGGLPQGLTEAGLVSELSRSGVVESVHPFDQQQQPLQQPLGGPQAPVPEEVYVVFMSLRDAAFCYESIAHTCPFGGSRPLVVEFCVAFPADSPAARRRAAAAAAAAATTGGAGSAASQFVWVSANAAGDDLTSPGSGPVVTPEVVVAALKDASVAVPQQILQVQGRDPGMLLQMASATLVPQVTACLQAAFALQPPPMLGLSGGCVAQTATPYGAPMSATGPEQMAPMGPIGQGQQLQSQSQSHGAVGGGLLGTGAAGALAGAAGALGQQQQQPPPPPQKPPQPQPEQPQPQLQAQQQQPQQQQQTQQQQQQQQQRQQQEQQEQQQHQQQEQQQTQGGGAPAAGIPGGGVFVEPPPPMNCRTIWIGQLHDSVREEELLSACRLHGGEVVSYRFYRPGHCAFIDFATHAAADAARRALHGVRMGPQHIRIEWKFDAGPAPRAPLMMPRGCMAHIPPLPGTAGPSPGGFNTGQAGVAGAGTGGMYGMSPVAAGMVTASVVQAGAAPGSGLPVLGTTAAGPAAAGVGVGGGPHGLMGQQPNPQAVAAASVAAAAAAVAARGAAYPGGPRIGADRWAPAVIPPPAPVPAPSPGLAAPGGPGSGPLMGGMLAAAAAAQQPGLLAMGFNPAGMNPAVAAAVRQAPLLLPPGHPLHQPQSQSQQPVMTGAGGHLRPHGAASLGLGATSSGAQLLPPPLAGQGQQLQPQQHVVAHQHPHQHHAQQSPTASLGTAASGGGALHNAHLYVHPHAPQHTRTSGYPGAGSGGVQQLQPPGGLLPQHHQQQQQLPTSAMASPAGPQQPPLHPPLQLSQPQQQQQQPYAAHAQHPASGTGASLHSGRPQGALPVHHQPPPPPQQQLGTQPQGPNVPLHLHPHPQGGQQLPDWQPGGGRPLPMQRMDSGVLGVVGAGGGPSHLQPPPLPNSPPLPLESACGSGAAAAAAGACSVGGHAAAAPPPPPPPPMPPGFPHPHPQVLPPPPPLLGPHAPQHAQQPPQQQLPPSHQQHQQHSHSQQQQAHQHQQAPAAAGGHPSVTWQGNLAKSGSHMCSLLCTSGGASAASGATPGEREPVTWPTTLDVKLRVDLSYVVHSLYSHTAPHARAMRRLFTAGGPDQRAKLSEFLSYLSDKNRAGVIKLEAAAGLPARTLYLVPPSEQVCATLGAEWTQREPFLLALVVPTTGGTAGGGKGGGAG